MQNPSSSAVVPKENLVPFLILSGCFALWGLVNAMAEQLVEPFGRIFEQTNFGASLTLFTHYSSYALWPIITAVLIKITSYKTGVLAGLALFIVGAIGYTPASMSQEYYGFLACISIYASGCSILETTCNPYILSMGDSTTAVRRLNFAQTFNPAGCLIGLLIGKYVIVANINPASLEARKAMTDVARTEVLSHDLFWFAAPYACVAALAIAIWFVIFFRRMPKGTVENETATTQTAGEVIKETAHTLISSVKILSAIPRYYWGVFTQFFYVGLQTMIWTYVARYAIDAVNNTPQEAAVYIIPSMVCFIIARIGCTALMKKFNPASMMGVMAVLGIVLCFGAIYLPSTIGLWCIILISLSLSLMFPTIYGIALKDLNSDAVKFGAAGLVMSILGGGILPPLMAKCLDHGWLTGLCFNMFDGKEAIVRTSFYIPMVCLVVVLIYALFNRKYVAAHSHVA